MNIQEFAKKNKVPVISKDSAFPKVFATHALKDEKVIKSEHLLASDQLEKSNYTTPIDAYLGTTNYVFFALGKGYLKAKGPSIGLIYDPFILAEQNGVNLVKNDLLYVLEKSQILHKFLLQNWTKTKELTRPNDSIFFRNYLRKNEPLLVCDFKDHNQTRGTKIFDQLLSHLPESLGIELKTEINNKIVNKETISSDLEKEIKDIFKRNASLLNLFFDETKEEKMFELRVPDKWPIAKGLIGVYQNR